MYGTTFAGTRKKNRTGWQHLKEETTATRLLHNFSYGGFCQVLFLSCIDVQMSKGWKTLSSCVGFQSLPQSLVLIHKQSCAKCQVSPHVHTTHVSPHGLVSAEFGARQGGIYFKQLQTHLNPTKTSRRATSDKLKPNERIDKGLPPNGQKVLRLHKAPSQDTSNSDPQREEGRADDVWHILASQNHSLK